MKTVMSAFVCLALCGGAWAQGPDFSGLPAAQEQDTAALIQQLLKRVAELERRVDALESSQAGDPAMASRLVPRAGGPLTTEGEAKGDPEAARLLAAATAEKEKLGKRLDGFTRADPRDARIQYSRVKSGEDWDATVADARRFAEALRASVGRPVTGGGRSSLEGLVRWARGRSVFQVRRVLDAKEHLILPLDFGTEVVALEK